MILLLQILKDVINETGELKIDPEDSSYSIESFNIKGYSLDLDNMRNRGTVNLRENILDAFHGDYYKENNKYYTFYKSQWYESEIIDDVDIFCPVDAMIFYTIKLRRDYF